MRPSPKAAFHALGPCEFFSQRLADQGLDGLPDHLPNYEAAGSDAALPAGHDLAACAQLPQFHLRQRAKPARHRRPSRCWRCTRQDAAARGIADGAVVRVFNDRGTYHCKGAVSQRARPGVVHGLGIWWRKLGLNGTNVNELTSQNLTDLGRAPVFYDCLVEVALLQKEDAPCRGRGPTAAVASLK
jgi:anaerobic selenocysteine-containing dehydrogenase